MRALINYGIFFLCSISSVFAAANNETHKVVNTVSYEHVLNWSLGLIIVLCLFFACIWMMRKMGTLPGKTKDSMKVVAGLSLGMREKIVLVQMGERQLVLGVTPGRVEKLLILEGSDQLFQDKSDSTYGGDFSSKLKQVMTGDTKTGDTNE